MLDRRPTHRTRFWHGRISAVLMLVLQFGMVLAPMSEREGRRTVTHIERQGTRHAQLHDEANCALCAVRSLQVAVLHTASMRSVDVVTERLDSASRTILTSRDPPPANASRAPPRLS